MQKVFSSSEFFRVMSLRFGIHMTILFQPRRKSQMSTIANQELLTATEAAVIFGVSRRSVLRWIESGKLPGWKVGFQFVVRASDVEKSKDKFPLYEKRKTASKITR
jgi:excisionase family DNA binding protein